MLVLSQDRSDQSVNYDSYVTFVNNNYDIQIYINTFNMFIQA